MMVRPVTTKGFSLIEMLVAVSVLLLVIVGPMTVTSRAAKSSAFASEQVQAFFLAQEGLELAQKLRDDLFLQYFAGSITDPWTRFSNNNGTYSLCYGTGGCGLEWANETTVASPISCGSTLTNCKLNFKDSASRSKYTYSTVAPFETTPFTRQIIFTRMPATNPIAVEVRSIVTWRTGSLIAEQRVETQTYLYNIYPQP